MLKISLSPGGKIGAQRLKDNYPHLYHLLIDEKGQVRSVAALEKECKDHNCKLPTLDCPLHNPG